MIQNILSILLFVCLVNGQLNYIEVPSLCKGQLRKGIFERINALRALHQVPNVAMSTNLTNLAQQNVTSDMQWNSHGKILARKTDYILPNNEIVLQKEFLNTSNSLSNSTFCYEFGGLMVDDAYSYLNYYNFSNNKPMGFYYDNPTQMIWKSSSFIGIGISALNGWNIRVFTRVWFFSPGNIAGEYLNNVFPKK